MSTFNMDRLEAELRVRSAALRRDAFIVSQVVAAAGETRPLKRASITSRRP
jgi:hypothetical protein